LLNILTILPIVQTFIDFTFFVNLNASSCKPVIFASSILVKSIARFSINVWVNSSVAFLLILPKNIAFQSVQPFVFVAAFQFHLFQIAKIKGFTSIISDL